MRDLEQRLLDALEVALVDQSQDVQELGTLLARPVAGGGDSRVKGRDADLVAGDRDDTPPKPELAGRAIDCRNAQRCREDGAADQPAIWPADDRDAVMRGQLLRDRSAFVVPVGVPDSADKGLADREPNTERSLLHRLESIARGALALPEEQPAAAARAMRDVPSVPTRPWLGCALERGVAEVKSPAR